MGGLWYADGTGDAICGGEEDVSVMDRKRCCLGVRQFACMSRADCEWVVFVA